MITHDLNQIETLIRSNDLVVHLRPKIQSIYGFDPATDDVNQLVASFEAISDLPPKRAPQYAVMFYWSLMVLYFDDIEGLAREFDIPLHQTSLRCLTIGMSIFLGGKSTSFKYQVLTGINRYKNFYEFVAEYVRHGYAYECSLNGWREILEFIFYVDRNTYYDLINADVGNVFFLLSVGYSPLTQTPQAFTRFLESDDPIKVNGAFYFLVHHEAPHAALTHLSHVDSERMVSVLLNYVYYEPRISKEFVDALVKQDPRLVISLTENQLDLSNPLQLIKLSILLDQYVEYQHVFCEHLKHWIVDSGNIHIWKSIQEPARAILNKMTDAVRDGLLTDLAHARSGMYLTNFDRHIRHSKYVQDQFKAQIVEDLLQQFPPV